MLEGSIRNLLAEGLFPVTALITAGVLSRRGGAEGYGVLVLAMTLIVWIQWCLNSLFSRATIKQLSGGADSRVLGSAATTLQLRAGLGAMALVWLMAVPLGRALGEPQLVGCLIVLALDLPLGSLVQAHRNILTGIGSFGPCALARAGYWVVRLVLIVALVEVRPAVWAAILGTIGASLVELALVRRYVQPSIQRSMSLADWPHWDYAWPLFISALSLSTFQKLDLFAVKALGGTLVDAGRYGAAQSLALLPGLFALALAPFLLSTLSRVLSTGEAIHARELGGNAYRFGLVMVSLAAAVAATSKEIVVLIFGDAFGPAAPLFAILIAGSTAMLILTVSTTVLVALGHPEVTARLTVLLLPLAILGHLLLVPRFGSLGAASVTTSVAILGALGGVFTVSRHWDLRTLKGTAWRSLAVAGSAYALGSLFVAPGLWAVPKVLTLAGLVLVAFRVLGEWSADEVALAGSVLRMGIIPGPPPGAGGDALPSADAGRIDGSG